MRTCPSCGARVADDLEWCNQCYSALPVAPAPAASTVADASAETERPPGFASSIGQPDVKIARGVLPLAWRRHQLRPDRTDRCSRSA